MQHQQDKDFDARLREKMEDFSVTPPAGLWDAIDGKMNGPAAPPVKRKISGAGWLQIAAGVCLLAAAGIWLYRYDSPFTKEAISINGKRDSITSPEPKVTVLNKSRVRGEEHPDETGRGEAGRGRAGQTGSAPEKAGISEGSPQNGTAPESSRRNATAGQTRAAQPGPEQTDGDGDDTGQPVERNVDTGRDETVLAAVPQNERSGTGSVVRPAPAVSTPDDDNAKISAIDPVEEDAGLLPEKENGSLARAEPDLEPLSAEPSGIKSTDGEAAKEGGILAAAFGRAGTKPAGTSAGEGEKTNSVLPEELREVSGVGEALNLVASTIDRSEDKFIRVRKDEESGKWEGVRLDLGILTISYNKPAGNKPSKKNRQERN